ncbi:MAG: Regulatory protein LysR:LysR, substrate-binding [Ramlibacter sp.]|nr:Regulatory protein LysR:LysR, substrate-binding [Ramlibacter sp.]
MRIDLYSLRLFVAVVDEGTIAAAAEKEFIAASALSKRVSELERSLGTPLLVRQARGVVPTAAGEQLALRGRKLLHDADDVAAQVRDFSSGAVGYVRVAANLSAITQFLPGDLASFQCAYPKVLVGLEERVSSMVTRAVQDNAAEIGIYASSDDEEGLEVFEYRRDRMVLVVPAGHPLATAPSVGFADTLAFEHVGMRRGSASDRQLLAAASAARQRLVLRYHVTSFDAMVSMIKAGLGVGVMPEGAFALFQDAGLQSVQLQDAWATRRARLCVRAGQDMSMASRRLLEFLQRAAGGSAG